MKVNPSHRELISSAAKAKSVENIGGIASTPTESSQLPGCATPAGASTAPAGTAVKGLDSKTTAKPTSKPEAKPSPAPSRAADAGAPSVADGARLSTTSKPRRKSPRREKPAAFKPEAKLNLNCTLERRDAIHATAEALGLTATEYMLLCEEKMAHQLVKHFAAYIESLVQMTREELQARMARLEELVKQRPSPN